MHLHGLPLALVLLLAAPAGAQNLSVEEIGKLIDERVNALNPYQAILNDPDPERALAGMEIMLQQGDATLRRMALEFGLLSPNPTVRRTALEGFLASGPALSIRFDGTGIEDKGFGTWIPNLWNGTVDSENIGYWRIQVSGQDEETKCYLDQNGKCFITVNSDGVFFTPDRMNGRADITPEGTLAGSANLYGITPPVPFSVQLLD
ncbi:MAG TPA: hypothetical protein PLL33_12055 [Paracoccus sp. (in: a-proteobacteria)]|nr:hypothetical protein [Paracoccus sp. (in: a-proteobacteria)]